MSTPPPRSAQSQIGANWLVYALALVLLAAAAGLLFSLLRPKPAAPGELQWSEPPAMTIDVNKHYTATLHLDKGDIVIELLPQAAPITVNNFVFLARQGFYDGVTFHRVLSGFMAQSGDPTGTGSGGPGYTFQDEFSPGLQFDAPGVVAMANSGPNSNGSQFFITYAPEPHLTGVHTIFGRVTAGMDVAEKLTLRDPEANPLEQGDVINSVTIDEQ
jgi:peptidylprolyl isomerase